MIARSLLAIAGSVALATCSSPPGPAVPSPTPLATGVDAAPADAAPPPDAAPLVPYLKGNTHVHARPSGDSTTDIPTVIAWYEARGYDFIVLTDHNRVSEVDGDTAGKVAVRAPASGLIVLAGIELTFNPGVCMPQDTGMKCRIHANGLGVTARPLDKLEWANRHTRYRVDMYARAATIEELGGLAQLNHPQWQWGMQGWLVIDLARRGFKLMEIANRQFDNWNVGDAAHASLEALWDVALTAGVDIWGVASDDAHDYRPDGGGRYPAGGGWIMVRAERDPDAIKAALAAGRFYASTGVVLSRADVIDGELVIEVDPTSPGDHAITFVEKGVVVETVMGRSARAAIPAGGYVRAVVRRADGAMAWSQPARGLSPPSRR